MGVTLDELAIWKITPRVSDFEARIFVQAFHRSLKLELDKYKHDNRYKNQIQQATQLGCTNNLSEPCMLGQIRSFGTLVIRKYGQNEP